MTTWNTCAKCDRTLYPNLCKATDEGWICTGRMALSCRLMLSRQVDNDARGEDLEWMAETGETLEGAANRIGLTVESLERWCDRNGRRDLFHQLRRNGAVDGRVRTNDYRRAS